MNVFRIFIEVIIAWKICYNFFFKNLTTSKVSYVIRPNFK